MINLGWLNSFILKVGLFIYYLQYFVCVVFVDGLYAVLDLLAVFDYFGGALAHVGELWLAVQNVLIFDHECIFEFLLSCFELLVEICHNVFDLVWVKMFKVVARIDLVFFIWIDA